jgi:hypothetical protein
MAQAEYAPAAMTAAMSKSAGGIGGGVASGVKGDSAHTYGYHRGRAYCSPGDYSIVRDLDREGDAFAASAYDVSLPPDQMVTVTQRLFDACWNDDPRVGILREFFGTLDGRNVTGWDRATASYTSSDDSHRWHVHQSIWRAYANEADALDALADVFLGVDNHQQSGLGNPLTNKIIIPQPSWEDDMPVLAPGLIQDEGGNWHYRTDGLDRLSLAVLPGEHVLYVTVDGQGAPTHPAEVPGWAGVRLMYLGAVGDDAWHEVPTANLPGSVVPLPYVGFQAWDCLLGARQVTARNISSAPISLRIGKE